jgi:putative DNA primase/helicase
VTAPLEDEYPDFFAVGDYDEDENPVPPDISPHTDIANAARLVVWHGAFIRYSRDLERWYGWDGRRWTQSKAPVMRAALAVGMRLMRDAKLRLIQAKREGSPEEQKAAQLDLKWAKDSQQASRIMNMVSLAAHDVDVLIESVAFDADPMLLNVQNGVLDLRTGKLLPHSPTYLMTKIAAVPYEREAACLTWEWLLNYAMGGDAEKIGFFRRYCGYILTGMVTEQCLLFNYGRGNNGKSTMMTALVNILGDYGCAAPRALLVKQHNEPHPAELLRLRGIRLALLAEVSESMQLDEGKLKDLTGGDKIAARGMGENFMDFTPTSKFVLNGNHEPRMTGTDNGLWRRWRLLPWTIPPEVIDTTLPDKLANEAAGILSWCVLACLEWQEHGLRAPECVLMATSQFREQSDELGEFFRLRCVREPAARSTRAMLWATYETHCKENGFKPVDAKRFCARLRAEGVEECKVRSMGKVRDGWAGITLRDDSLEGEPDSKAQLS